MAEREQIAPITLTRVAADVRRSIRSGAWSVMPRLPHRLPRRVVAGSGGDSGCGSPVVAVRAALASCPLLVAGSRTRPARHTACSSSVLHTAHQPARAAERPHHRQPVAPRPRGLDPLKGVGTSEQHHGRQAHPFDPAGGRASRGLLGAARARMIVARLTPTVLSRRSRPACAAGTQYIDRATASLSGVVTVGRPRVRPRARAALRPAIVRSRIRSRLILWTLVNRPGFPAGFLLAAVTGWWTVGALSSLGQPGVS